MSEQASSKGSAGETSQGIVRVEPAERIARLKDGPQWAAGDRVAESLAKNDEVSITLLMLKQHASLKEHKARGTATVAVLAGSIRLNNEVIRAGSIAVIGPEVPHAVEALEESALLLTAVLK